MIETLENRLYLTAAAYTWQNANIGAGGFVDGIFYDPHNQNTIYARTDIGGLYKSPNDGTNWTQLLDFVGNNTTGSTNGTQQQEIGVLSFAIDPENSNNIYADVGEYSGTNGAVFYSTNGGQTWGQTNLSFYVGGNSNGRGDGEQIQVDPNDSNIVFLGSNDHGLWESTNAGHTFTRISTGIFSPTSTTFVLFDPTGTPGSPSQTIYVGIDSTSAGTNLYLTTNGGTSWAQVTGTGTLPTGYLPGHAVLSGGNLYLGYANAEAPNGSITNGGVYRYNTSTGVWASISPLATAGNFGYDGIAADPQNPNTIVVTSFDDYSGPDRMWRTVNANAATPSWTEVYDYATAQNNGYGGYDTTRNTTNAPWTQAFGDGISNWVATVAINPFNSNQLMYGTGQGIWATNNISNNGANTQLTAANSWYFPDTGIEFTAVGGVAAPTAGIPLYSAMGDIGGFGNTTLAFSPQQGSVGGSGYTTDYAGTNPVDAVIVGSMGTNDGTYTTNDGATFTGFAANPGGATKFTGGTVAMSANGSTIVWAPSTKAAYYSTNNGATWTLSSLGASGALPTGGVIVSDKVNPNYFYYWTENSNDNSWTIYISSDGGQTFNASAGGALGTGNTTLAANPYVAGQLWVSSYIGMYESTNFGASFTHMGSFSAAANGNDMALGAPAPGSSIPAIYIYGTIASGGFEGVYRSDDGGVTWTQLNDVSHQWGGLIQTLAADPNVFGRVYLGINGRGIIMGNPASSLPASWSDVDINSPGNPGWAASSTTLSSGTIVNQWNINGGGVGLAATPVSITSLTVTGNVATAVSTVANGFQVGQLVTIAGATNSAYNGTFVITGLANTSAGIASKIPSATAFTFNVTSAGTTGGAITATLDDQFNYAYEPITGNVVVSAELVGLTNADNSHGTPQAGVMFRASTSASDPFIAMVQTSASSLVLEYRTTAGGTVTTQTVSGIPVGSEYLEIIRDGSNFSGLYSANGTSWTQLGSTVVIAAMPATANVGLCATASYNPQLTDAKFTNVMMENFAVPSGSMLNVNLSAAGPVSLNSSGGMITAIQNGVQVSFAGITAVNVTDTASGDVLNFNGPIALPFGFTNAGAAAVNVNSGTLTFAAVPGGTIDLGTLSVLNGATAAITAATTQNPTTLNLNNLVMGSTGTLDVANNQVLINYGSGADPIASIAAWLATGYNSGAWNGTGIISTIAQSNPNYGLGYADAADLNNPANLPTGQIKILYTLLGDANLDSAVNGSDFAILSSNFNKGVNGWDQGDFNYDGAANGSDFAALSTNFNKGSNIAAVAAVTPAPSPVVTNTNSTTSNVSTPQATQTAAAVVSTSGSDDDIATKLNTHAKKKSRHGARS